MVRFSLPDAVVVALSPAALIDAVPGLEAEEVTGGVDQDGDRDQRSAFADLFPASGSDSDEDDDTGTLLTPRTAALLHAAARSSVTARSKT